MPSKKNIDPTKPIKQLCVLSLQDEVGTCLAWLEEKSTDHDRKNLTRFAINASKAFGVSMANLKVLAKQLGRSHQLAEGLWETGWYEARLLASLVDEPARVTSGQMDRWRRDFDNWAICDTVCFALFDRSRHAWSKVAGWRDQREEFGRRAAFALLWALTIHDKQSGDEPFVESLGFVEQAADDERHFVKKAVNMALRAIGKRNSALNAAALTVAERLAESANSTSRWIGKDSLRELRKWPKS